MKIGLYTVSLHDLAFEEALDRMAEWGLETAEVAAGGFVPTPHCPAQELLDSADRRSTWLEAFAARSVSLASLNVNGNPLHPDRAVSDKHAADVERAIRLAPLVGVDRVIVMPGAPGCDPSAGRTGWYVSPWESGLLEARDYQWGVAVPFWRRMAELAAEHGVRICVEAHPHTVVYNPATTARLIESVGSDALGVNLDPSHYFWQGIDPVHAIEVLGDRVWSAAAKDTALFPDAIALHGVLDDRYSYVEEDPYPLGGGYTVTRPASDGPWRFTAVGRGHGAEWWGGFIRALQGVGYDENISIENEDWDFPVEEAVPFAAQTLREAMERSK